jgi:hypothetical protein
MACQGCAASSGGGIASSASATGGSSGGDGDTDDDDSVPGALIAEPCFGRSTHACRVVDTTLLASDAYAQCWPVATRTRVRLGAEERGGPRPKRFAPVGAAQVVPMTSLLSGDHVLTLADGAFIA